MALKAAQLSLREARRLALLGGSDKTAARVRAALKSLAGALRHAEHLSDRARRAGELDDARAAVGEVDADG